VIGSDVSTTGIRPPEKLKRKHGIEDLERHQRERPAAAQRDAARVLFEGLW
jgi:hypothetical protein